MEFKAEGLKIALAPSLSARNFGTLHVSACVFFGTVDVPAHIHFGSEIFLHHEGPATGMLRHCEVLAWKYFSTMDILVGPSATISPSMVP